MHLGASRCMQLQHTVAEPFRDAGVSFAAPQQPVSDGRRGQDAGRDLGEEPGREECGEHAFTGECQAAERGSCQFLGAYCGKGPFIFPVPFPLLFP